MTRTEAWKVIGDHNSSPAKRRAAWEVIGSTKGKKARKLALDLHLLGEQKRKAPKRKAAVPGEFGLAEALRPLTELVHQYRAELKQARLAARARKARDRDY